MRHPTCVVITGASSGIGQALATAYAAPGLRLALTGRDSHRLAKVAEQCRTAGADVDAVRLDVSDAEAMARWLTSIDAARAVDLVIANAGISGGTAGGSEQADQSRRILSVNLDGVLNTVLPLVPAMQERRHGQIAIMASLAGFRGFPGAPAYCASKAAVRVWGEALRGHLAPDGVGVSVICPGYIRSRMTAANQFSMPFLMDTDRAARLIRRRLAHNRSRIVFPWQTASLVWLLATLPPSWTDGLLMRLPKKR